MQRSRMKPKFWRSCRSRSTARQCYAIEQQFETVRRHEPYTGHQSERNLALYQSLGYHEFSRRRQSDAVTLVSMEKRKP